MSTIIINKIEYNMIHQDNGEILLKPITKNITITKKKDLSKYDFCNSVIVVNKINEDVCNKNKYKSILDYIYDIIGNGTQIIKNTTLNIKTIEKTDNGFYYLEDLGISIQGVDSNKCIYEIFQQCKMNNITLELSIKLNNLDNIFIEIK
jgi:hypothetical protein